MAPARPTPDRFRPEPVRSGSPATESSPSSQLQWMSGGLWHSAGDAPLEWRAPSLRPSRLEARQELHEVAAQLVAEIAAFLDQHGRQVEARDLHGHGVEA